MATVKGKTKQQLLEENEQLRARLAAAEEALRAIQKGDAPTVRRVAANWTQPEESAGVRRQRGVLEEASEELAVIEEELRRQNEDVQAAQLALAVERQKFNDVLNMLPAYVILLSPDYHVPLANRFFEERFGKSNGRRCYEYLFHRTEPCENCETYKVLKTGSPHRWQWNGPDGCNYDIYDFPFTDADGSPLIMEVGIDVTKIRRAQAALSEANETLEQRVAERTAELRESEANAQRHNTVLTGLTRILESSLHAASEQELGEACLTVAAEVTQIQFGFIGEIGPDGCLHDLAVSDPGWTACTMQDQTGRRRPPGNFAIHGLYGRVIVNGASLIANDPASHPDRIGLPEGHPPLNAFLGVPLMQEGAAVGLIAVANREEGYDAEQQQDLEALAPVVVQALTRRRAEESLEKATEELKRSNQDLQQFAYVAGHDLQEPLRAVIGFMNLLEKKYGPQLDAEAREYIRFAASGAARMSDMIRDLLAYSRVDRKGREPKPVDAEKCLAAALANLDASIRERDVRVTYDRLPTLPVDGIQLTQLFQNLIGNAIKFRKPGQPCFIHIGANRDEGQWVLFVRDNGIGIAPEQHGRVFDIFHRLHSRENYPGTGIGLAICKRIVERHGGRIWVESQPGQGATFRLALPRKDA